MMKKTRPRQHVRRLKNGKRVIVNRGVKKKKKRAMSQLHLKTPKNVKVNYGEHDPRAVEMFTLISPDYTDKIFIAPKAFLDTDFSKQSKINMISGAVAHEEMHNFLNREIGPEASVKFDNIAIDSLNIPGDDFYNQTSDIQYPSEAAKKRALIGFYLNDKESLKNIISADFPPNSQLFKGVPMFEKKKK